MSMAAEEHTSLLRRSLLRPVEPIARGELKWSEDTSAAPTIASAVLPPPKAQPAQAEMTQPQTGEPTPEDVVSAEIAKLRADALQSLEAELRTRRAELERTLERDRAASEARLAAAERLQQEAFTRRGVEMDRWGEQWAAQQHELLAGRIGTALSAELADVRSRYQQAESRILGQVEARRREETAALESWRASERERIEAELAAEQARVHERLLQQLKDFEMQLAERQREQEERIARWWEEAGRRARQQVATLLDEALKPSI